MCIPYDAAGVTKRHYVVRKKLQKIRFCSPQGLHLRFPNLLIPIYALNRYIMELALNYRFERRTKNHLEWLVDVIKSEKYYQAESYIPNHEVKAYCA
jgi:hypothetical protein